MLYNNIMIILAILPAAWALIGIFNFFTREHKPPPQDSRQHYEPRNFKLLSLQRLERKDKPWVFLNILAVLSSLPLLAFDGYFFYLWITNKSAGDLDILSVIVLLIMVVLPIWVLIDTFIRQPRIRKRGRSGVAEPVTMELEGDIGILFEQCQKALVDMGVRITKLDFESKFIKADFGKDVMTIEIEQTEHLRNKVTILSDSKLKSVIFDFGSNRRNVDIFIKTLLHG
jgi:hypothetical protein